MMQNCALKGAYTKLSLHYFFYFTVLGALLPYLGLYLQSLTFTPVEIGQLMAVLLITKVIAPNVWGWLADKSGKPILLVRIANGLTFLMALGLLWYQSYWALFLIILAFSFFWHASLPQFESYTFDCLGAESKHRYGSIRVWGSIGFIAAVLFIGWQIETFGVEHFPFDLIVLLLAVWLTTFLVKENQRQHAHDEFGFAQIIKRPDVWGLLLVSFLMQLSHGVYYTFFTIHLTDLGYSQTVIAWLWSLGVLAEVFVFIWMGKLFKTYAIRWLILLSIILTVIRWSLNASVADSIWWMLFAQTLHAASFGLFHAAAIHLIDEYFKGNHQGKGQAVYAASSHGLGGAVGMFLAGYAWAFGGAQLAYGLSAAVVVLSGLIAYKTIQVQQQ